MQNSKKGFANKVLAWVISLAMILPMFPASALAGPEEKKAGGAIESQVSNDAKNAIHAYVGIQVGGDLNLPLSGGAQNQQFIPIEGVRAYFQWFENGGYASPVYTAVSDAQGRLNIGLKPYLASDGKIIKFDADTTVSGGNEKYRFWIDDKNLPASLKDHQLQYITGENVVFPSDNSWVSQGGATTDVVPNTISDMKILFMEKPKAFMHKANATETPPALTGIGSGGTVWGKVTWDYESPSGGTQWGIVATPSSPAPGVQIKASYLSDYALKQIYSDATVARMNLRSADDIRGSKWSYALEAQLQKWIQEQVEAHPDQWIAETVTTKTTGPITGTNAEGDYKIQFNGTWGPARNGDVYDYKIPPSWPQALKDRVGKVADKATDGSFTLAALPKDAKHINNDWMFISAVDTEDIRVMTPYNNNWFTGISGLTGNWGYHNGWAQTAFGNTTALAANNVRADFGFGSPGINFDITNYDSDANTALPGDVAQTKTTGLPYKHATDKFVIVWYDPDGNEVPNSRGTAQQPSSTGTIPSAPLDTSKLTINKTTEYTAKLYRVKPDGSLENQPIAADSFTVEVSHLFISRYDNVSIANPKAGDKEMKGATYSATGLPADLKIGATDGTISGKAKEAGLYKVNFKTVLPDPSGNIEGTRARYIAVTDSPLKAGEVGVAYSQDVKPEPATDPNGRPYIYKMKSVKFTKAIDGLSVTGDAAKGFKITGTPIAKVEATEDVLNGDPGPNVEVTYDIYKTNDAGKEVLVKANHVDKVPLVVTKAKDNSLYEPKYTAVDGKVGTEATVAAPTFTDKDNKPVTPTGVTYALGADAPTGAQVDPNTGVVTYTPKTGEEGQAINVPVVVTYSDGTKDNATAKINVAKKDSDLYTPAYADKAGKAGEAATTEAPTFTDADGKATTAPDGTKYKLGDGAPEGATIDENTGKVTYTPKESEAGKPVEIPVVVTYPDKSTDNAKAKINVAKLDDVIDRTNNPNATTPDGYHRVTFVAGDGVEALTNPPVYDVKDGVALTADKYPTATAKDGYENPVWSTPAGTAITAANATITATATSTTPAQKTADKLTPAYADKAGKAGEAATTEAPTFTDADGKATTAPDGTKYKLGDGAPEGATIDENTGKVTYTPKESEAGKPVEIPVVVTYPDKSTDNAKAKINVAKLDDVIDRTNNPNATTPDGYHRVTFVAGDGVEALTNPPVYDVKDGVALTADKYPTATAKDGYENPVWSTPAGTAITAANATITATATSTTPAQKTADKLTPAYADKAGKAGEAATTEAPTFTDADGKATTAPDGTKYKLGDGAPEGATIDENTGKVTYTPKESEAGKPVEIPVVVTYPDKSTDNAKAKINVAKLDDVIDRTNNPNATTPDGYHRVTFVAGDGVEALTNPPVYDVKDGVALTADKYPTATAKDGYENPVWSTPAGTAITAANATITATATSTTPAQKTADKLTPAYADKAGKAGEAATTEAPTFTDADGKATTAPDGTKYKLGDGAPEGATIDENTGKVTYTPKESEAGKPVEIPVVVTYPDKSTDNAKAKINVAKLDDVIDRTNNPNATTPDGYHRVTFVAGDGVEALTNPPVYDVKDGVALTADKYPTATAKDGYENPVWSTPAGTAITAANATITATATSTTPDTTAPKAPTVTANDDGSVTVTPPTDADTKTVTVKYKDNDGNDKTVTATKGDDGKWKVPAGSEVTVDETTGAITIPEDKVKDNTDVTATAKDGSNNESEAGKATAKAKTPGGNNNVVPPQKPTIDQRIGGKDRIDTAIEISKKYYSYADNVIIARSDDFPDALTASVLAKALNAPILLTNPGALDSRVKAEIERLGAKNIYIIGRENAISMNAEGQLKALGKVERIGGSDRYETSAMVARRVVGLVGDKGIAVIATGENFADALSMSPFAAKNGYPILLVSHNKVPGVIEKAIKDLGIKSVYIAGREMAVSYKVQKALPKLIERVGGSDRYETSAKIAETFFTNANKAFMASGQVFADALVIGPVAANENAPVLLTRSNELPKAIKKNVEYSNYKNIVLIGLKNAIGEKVEEALTK